jgi:hypothetical protein
LDLDADPFPGCIVGKTKCSTDHDTESLRLPVSSLDFNMVPKSLDSSTIIYCTRTEIFNSMPLLAV